jgi:hypothetical protein
MPGSRHFLIQRFFSDFLVLAFSVRRDSDTIWREPHFRQFEQDQPMDNQQPTYNLSLLFAFIANVFQLISVSLLFRYADFITSIVATNGI